MLGSLRSVVVLLGCAIRLAISSAGQQLYTDLEARGSDLSPLQAKSPDPTDVLAASLETIPHHQNVCCGKDSALEDSVARADLGSLRDIASKLWGRPLLSDGRPIVLTAEFWSSEDVNGASLIKSFSDKHPLLTLWNGHLYVATASFTGGFKTTPTLRRTRPFIKSSCGIRDTPIPEQRWNSIVRPTTLGNWGDSCS